MSDDIDALRKTLGLDRVTLWDTASRNDRSQLCVRHPANVKRLILVAPLAGLKIRTKVRTVLKRSQSRDGGVQIRAKAHGFEPSRANVCECVYSVLYKH